MIEIAVCLTPVVKLDLPYIFFAFFFFHHMLVQLNNQGSNAFKIWFWVLTLYLYQFRLCMYILTVLVLNPLNWISCINSFFCSAFEKDFFHCWDMWCKGMDSQTGDIQVPWSLWSKFVVGKLCSCFLSENVATMVPQGLLLMYLDEFFFPSVSQGSPLFLCIYTSTEKNLKLQFKKCFCSVFHKTFI